MDKRRMGLPLLSAQFWKSCHVVSRRGWLLQSKKIAIFSKLKLWSNSGSGLRFKSLMAAVSSGHCDHVQVLGLFLGLPSHVPSPIQPPTTESLGPAAGPAAGPLHSSACGAAQCQCPATHLEQCLATAGWGHASDGLLRVLVRPGVKLGEPEQLSLQAASDFSSSVFSSGGQLEVPEAPLCLVWWRPASAGHSVSGQLTKSTTS